MNTNPLNGRRVKHGQLKDDDKGGKSRRKSITRRLSAAFLSAFQSSSSVSQNTVIKDDRSEDSENEEKKFEFLRLPKTEKDTTIAYPRYPRPL
eukprot:g2279.t1